MTTNKTWEKDVLALAKDVETHEMLIGVIESLLSQQREEILGKIGGMKFKLGEDGKWSRKDRPEIYAVQLTAIGYNQALSDIEKEI